MNRNEIFEQWLANLYVNLQCDFVITPEQIKAKRGSDGAYRSSMHIHSHWDLFNDFIDSDVIKNNWPALVAAKQEGKIMKPFNLEAAIRGEPLVTRDGRKAKFVAYVPELEDGCKVIACVESQRSVIAYHDDGKYYGFEADDIDLFMCVPTSTLAGIEFPEPLREPVIDERVWAVDLLTSGCVEWVWGASDYQKNALKRGLIQSTKEGAEQQLRAMIKSVGGSYD